MKHDIGMIKSIMGIRCVGLRVKYRGLGTPVNLVSPGNIIPQIHHNGDHT